MYKGEIMKGAILVSFEVTSRKIVVPYAAKNVLERALKQGEKGKDITLLSSNKISQEELNQNLQPPNKN